jgi:hypothetical protein
MFDNIDESQEAYEEMNGRKYDGNELKLVYIKESLYQKSFQK